MRPRDAAIRQSDVTRAVKGAIDGYRARGLVPGAVSVSIADGAVSVRIEPPAESATACTAGGQSVAELAAEIRARAAGRA